MLGLTSLYHRGAIRTDGLGPFNLATGTVKLPMDVEENIIDQLEDVIPSLRNCALTCRAWRPRSRYHLVSSIQIRTRKDFASLCEFFERHRNLASLVKALTIFPSDEEPSPRSLVEVALVELLRQLPNLRQYKLVYDLHVNDGARPTYSTTFHPRSLTHFKMYLHAETLRLGPLRLLSHEELARIVIALPRLRTLQCRGLTFGRQNGGSESSVRFANKTCLSDVSVSSTHSLYISR
ncbi:hypothetical protein K466DRAFT_111572 [Polyporus arcularius HHB13444]|uniref:F-box domain-containing protein n=1 Tax=Polyporus arcularius HHB13444 TaxID=1314778 RepID=A0A5C3PCZ3_9APHY|nr:hypothetical protein K466DRAFT_111572 [Polyporus arcularius HHB13444]